MNFFTNGITMERDPDLYFDSFERLGVFYIARNRGLMYFKENKFYRNSGTFGGAITIDSPNFRTETRPFLFVDGCEFENNQGYFGGNAIYMRNTKRLAN